MIRMIVSPKPYVLAHQTWNNGILAISHPVDDPLEIPTLLRENPRHVVLRYTKNFVWALVHEGQVVPEDVVGIGVVHEDAPLYMNEHQVDRNVDKLVWGLAEDVLHHRQIESILKSTIKTLREHIKLLGGSTR